MNSLPSISHRLLVSAVGHQVSATKPARASADEGFAGPPPRVIPLEVIANDQPLPAGATRPLRAAATKGRA